MTIFDHGGHWAYVTSSGITTRHMYDPTDCTYPWVASMCRHPKLIIYYTDWHDVDEDRSTIPAQGGYQDHDSFAGIVFRYVLNPPFDLTDWIASIQK